MKIAVASGKGGTGKTTVSVKLFQALKKSQNTKVHLIDCDVEEPNDMLFFPQLEKKEGRTVKQMVPNVDTNKCTYCRKCAEYCEFNAIMVIPPAKVIRISEDLCHSCGACLYACPENALSEKYIDIGEINTYKHSETSSITEGRLKVGLPLQTPLIRQLKKYSHGFEGISVYDAPPGTSCSVVETLMEADFIILVTEPTPFGFNDLKITMEVVKNLGIPFGLVINKAGIGDNEIYEYLQQQNIPLLAEIPFSEDIAKAYSDGSFFMEEHHATDSIFKKLSERILKSIEKHD